MKYSPAFGIILLDLQRDRIQHGCGNHVVRELRECGRAGGHGLRPQVLVPLQQELVVDDDVGGGQLREPGSHIARSLGAGNVHQVAEVPLPHRLGRQQGLIRRAFRIIPGLESHKEEGPVAAVVNLREIDGPLENGAELVLPEIAFRPDGRRCGVGARLKDRIAVVPVEIAMELVRSRTWW